MRTSKEGSQDKAKRKRRARLEREYERKETPWDSIEEPTGWLHVFEQLIIFSGALAFLIGFWYFVSVLILKLLQKGGGTQ
ncbi:MAG: hypothetical protein ABIH66_13275 [bacterium]